MASDLVTALKNKSEQVLMISNIKNQNSQNQMLNKQQLQDSSQAYFNLSQRSRRNFSTKRMREETTEEAKEFSFRIHQCKSFNQIVTKIKDRLDIKDQMPFSYKTLIFYFQGLQNCQKEWQTINTIYSESLKKVDQEMRKCSLKKEQATQEKSESPSDESDKDQITFDSLESFEAEKESRIRNLMEKRIKGSYERIMIDIQMRKQIVHFLQTTKVFQAPQMVNLIEKIGQCRLKDDDLWKTVQDIILYSTVYEDVKSAIEVLEQIKMNYGQFSSDIYEVFLNTILMDMAPSFSCSELINIVQIYRFARKGQLCKELTEKCKHYVVEDIDNLNISQLNTVIDVYKSDPLFKRFIGFQVKEKIIKNPNLNSRELQHVLIAVLDLEDLRGDVIKWALNSELFYSMPLSFYIQIIRIIRYKIEYHPDFYDLLKTIQIQISLQEKEINESLYEQIVKHHYHLPVLNVHFLLYLLRHGNMQKMLFSKHLIHPFALNISLLNLPNITYQPLIEEYNLSLINALNINEPSQLEFNMLMRVLVHNPQFARYGFYQGFTDMLFACLINDTKNNDLWMLNNIQRIILLDCSDQSFFFKVRKLIHANFDTYLQTALLKLISLVSKVCPEDEVMREVILKRSRLIRPNLIQDMKLSISMVQDLAILLQHSQNRGKVSEDHQLYLQREREANKENDQSLRSFQLLSHNDSYLRHFHSCTDKAMEFSILEINRVLHALHITRLHEEPSVQGKILNMLQRTSQLVKSYQYNQLSTITEEIVELFHFIPAQHRATWLGIIQATFQTLNSKAVSNYRVNEQVQLSKMYMRVLNQLQKIKQLYSSEEFVQTIDEIEKTYANLKEQIEEYEEVEE